MYVWNRMRYNRTAPSRLRNGPQSLHNLLFRRCNHGRKKCCHSRCNNLFDQSEDHIGIQIVSIDILSAKPVYLEINETG